MLRLLPILLLLAAIIALPFALRPRTESAATTDRNAPRLVIVTPHNEAIRYEFERAFSQYYQKHHGTPIKIEWRAVGGTTEIMRFLASEYAAAARNWWTRSLKKDWPSNATDTLTQSAAPTDADLLELWKTFRGADDPAAFTPRIDLFFGGGDCDHSTPFRQGITVPPWPPGSEPTPLFFLSTPGQSAGRASTRSAAPDLIALIPEQLSGETLRAPAVLGNV